MKLSQTMIFILLLLFLVISVLLCRWAKHDIDGFIGYQYTAVPLDTVTLPMYSQQNLLHKMYDNLYFDNKNGNIVEVDASSYGNISGNIDTQGSTITALHTVPRIGNSVISYAIDSVNDVIPTPSTVTEKSYNSKVYRTICESTETYNVFMMPWQDNTYLHIMNNPSSSVENIGTYAFTNNSSALQYDYPDNTAMTGIRETRADKDPNNNTMVIDPIYNSTRKVYQISQYVKYDISSSNLLIGVGDKQTKVYQRNGNTVQTLTSISSDKNTKNGEGETISNVTFAPRIIYDLCGQNMVLYVPNAKNTLVALICYNSENKLDLRNVCRFNEIGLDKGDQEMPSSKNTDNSPAENNNENDMDKFLELSGIDMDKYMLKTQIVPPVCPTCPSCNYNQGGACGQCGGNGGSGTQTKNGNSLVTGGNQIRDVVKATGNIAGDAVGAAGNVLNTAVSATGNVLNTAVDATGSLVNKTVDAAGNIADKTVDAAGNVADKTVDAAGNVVNKTVDAAGNVVNKTVDAAGNVVNKTVDAAGNVVSGAMGTVGNVASSALGAVGNVASSALGAVGNVLGNANIGQSTDGSVPGTTSGAMQLQSNIQSSPPVSGGTSTTDPYSYYGQLPTKKSNVFMPVTADFSKFGR